MKTKDYEVTARPSTFGKVSDTANSIIEKSIYTLAVTTIECPNKKKSNIKPKYSKTKKTEKEKKDEKTLKRALRNLKKMIIHNFEGDISELFLTLTFEFEITTEELCKQFNYFWRKFERKYSDFQEGFRCLVVIEPTGPDRYHLHCLLKRLDGKKLSITKSDLEKLWNNGFVDIKKLRKPLKLANYLNPFKVPRKRKNIGFYKHGSRIFRKRGTFETVSKYTAKHSEVVELAEKEGFELVECEAFEIIKDGKKINTIKKEIYRKSSIKKNEKEIQTSSINQRPKIFSKLACKGLINAIKSRYASWHSNISLARYYDRKTYKKSNIFKSIFIKALCVLIGKFNIEENNLE